MGNTSIHDFGSLEEAMPWMETDLVTERQKFVNAYETGLWTVTELCERYRISRKTGYKILARWDDEGEAGLEDRSRAPHSCPHRMSDEVEALILAAKLRYPRWGARKIRALIAREHPRLTLPAKSSVFDCLERHGKVQKKRRRKKHKHPGSAPLITERPNQVWPVDFKGQFKLGNGQLCYPLTITDHYSRSVLECHGLTSVRTERAQPVFDRLFRRVGMPDAIRSDNGSPFASVGIRGLCKLNVWWLQLGIAHQRIKPASPQENGQHERMHRDLKMSCAMPSRHSMQAQQRAFNEWRREYNEERPHEALDDDVPASKWEPSSRPFPKKIQPPYYPSHYRVRRVSSAGTFRINVLQPFISSALAGLDIGVEEIEEGIHNLFFYDTLIARYDERRRLLNG